MGKGDRRTAKGKRFVKSFGKTRKSKQPKRKANPPAAAAAVIAPAVVKKKAEPKNEETPTSDADQ